MHTWTHWYRGSYGKSSVSWIKIPVCHWYHCPQKMNCLCFRNIAMLPAYPATDAALNIITAGATRQPELYYPWFTYIVTVTKDWTPSITNFILQYVFTQRSWNAYKGAKCKTFCACSVSRWKVILFFDIDSPVELNQQVDRWSSMTVNCKRCLRHYNRFPCVRKSKTGVKIIVSPHVSCII